MQRKIFAEVVLGKKCYLGFLFSWKKYKCYDRIDIM